MKNFGDYVYFSYLGNNPKYGFFTYNDAKTGLNVGYVIGYDAKGQPIYKKWRFNLDSMRQVRVGPEEQDKTGMKAVDFLRNSPECFGSPSGSIGEDGKQIGFYFKEVKDGEDAANALNVRKISIDAQNAVLELKGEKLKDFCALIPIFSKDESILAMKALDYASNYPTKTLEMLKDPARDVKALVEKAIDSGVFNVDGKQIKWETKLIGADKEDAIVTLLKDEKLRKAVQLNLDKFGG